MGGTQSQNRLRLAQPAGCSFPVLGCTWPPQRTPCGMQEAQAGEFWSYAAGTAYRLLVDFGVGGLSIDNYR